MGPQLVVLDCWVGQAVQHGEGLYGVVETVVTVGRLETELQLGELVALQLLQTILELAPLHQRNNFTVERSRVA